MDNIFDRAHDLIDRAQEKVAGVTSQAAWAANQALVTKNLEGQIAALQVEMDRITSDLGERTYQVWKAGRDDPRMPALCSHLDDLKGRRARLSADLNAVRSATYDPRSAQNALPGDSSVTAAPRPVIAAPPPTPAQPPPPSRRPAPPVGQSAPADRAARSAAPAGAVPQPRECPNCGHFVPAAAEYCPACGNKVI